MRDWNPIVWYWNPIVRYWNPIVMVCGDAFHYILLTECAKRNELYVADESRSMEELKTLVTSCTSLLEVVAIAADAFYSLSQYIPNQEHTYKNKERVYRPQIANVPSSIRVLAQFVLVVHRDCLGYFTSGLIADWDLECVMEKIVLPFLQIQGVTYFKS
jgi:hypothetical protein